MTTITQSTAADANLLSILGKQTFIESHGHSAPKADADSYIERNFTPEVFQAELNDEKNIYHIIYNNSTPAGFSKIILNYPHPSISHSNVTKLERIYILKRYYNLKLGAKLFKFNLNLSKENQQSGMWLFVWKENSRAIKFYEKRGFKIIGSHDFKISETHSNPNHIMYLEY
jgi:ribosomal protein S18 acetylase RimI-like enzyme